MGEFDIEIRKIGSFHEIIITGIGVKISSGLLDDVEAQRMAVELTEAVESLLNCEIELPIRRDI